MPHWGTPPLAKIDMIPTDTLFKAQYYNDITETTPMTDTTNETTLTSEEILEQLSNDEYRTQSGLIVGKTWSGCLAIANNPLKDHNNLIILGADDAQELRNLQQLVEASMDKDLAKGNVNIRTAMINNIKKEGK